MTKPSMKFERFLKNIKINGDLEDVREILKRSEKYDFTSAETVRTGIVDNFLFSGKFNSVLGPDGFTNFKDSLKDVVKKVNAGDFGANYLNIDRTYEALLVSGVYYVENYLPEDLNDLKADQRWLTAYRYIAKNFPSITYSDFREMIVRFKDSNGFSIYIEPTDSKFLKDLASNDLFKTSIDVKASLLHLEMKVLRSICEKLSIPSARSAEDTVERIVKAAGEGAKSYLPEQVAGRITLVIEDQELATGSDLIKLDAYLRTIAKVIRDDFVEFVNRSRFGTLAA